MTNQQNDLPSRFQYVGSKGFCATCGRFAFLSLPETDPRYNVCLRCDD